jgi:putative ABC transport system permease protein
MLAMLGSDHTSATYEDNMEMFGAVDPDNPSMIEIYVDTFEDKDGLQSCIDAYNASVPEEDRITYTDYIGLITGSVTSIINSVSSVLIAFVAISLVVSSIMIGIITYISVLERTKEIGILRALGASKRNIAQVFNAETFIIGLLAGVMGIVLSEILLIPINRIIPVVTETDGIVAFLPPFSALVLVALSVLLTLISGIIPARKASKRDPVVALRSGE